MDVRYAYMPYKDIKTYKYMYSDMLLTDAFPLLWRYIAPQEALYKYIDAIQYKCDMHSLSVY